MDNFQSGLRTPKIINDICLYSDTGKISVLVLLRAAFDTVDHNIQNVVEKFIYFSNSTQIVKLVY